MKTAILIVLLILCINPIFGQEFQWVNSYGNHTSDNSTSTTVDQNGNSYITGFVTYGTIIGDYHIQNRGMYVAKFDPNGEFIWAMESDGAFNTQPTDIVCDYLNNVIITGYYSHNISFGDIDLPYAIQPRMFLVKYSSAGNVLWAKSYGSVSITRKTYTNGITVDDAGHIYTTGAFNSLLVFGDITLESKISGSYDRFDIFLAKFDMDGDPIWAKRAGGEYDDYAYSTTFDNVCNIYVSGVFQPSQADFGNIEIDIENTRARDFIAKFDIAGNTIWVKSGDVGSEGYSETTSIKTDNYGNLYAFGNYYDPVIYEDDTLTNGTNFLIKLDSNGNKIYTKSLNTDNWSHFSVEGTWSRKIGDIILDHNNNLFLTTKFRDTLSFGNDTLISYQNHYGFASTDIFVAKYNEIGFPQWVVRAGGNLDEYAKSIMNDSSNLYISGYYASLSATFGDSVITNNSGNENDDLYLTKIIDTTQNQCPDINPTLTSSSAYTCGGDSVLLSCESNYGSSFLWVVNDSIYSFQYSNDYWANDSLKVYVVVNPNTICSDTSNTIYLEKRPKPIVEIIASSDTIICPDSTVNIFTHFDNTYEYFWLRDDQIIDYGINNTNVSTGGIYSVDVFKNGCKNSDWIQVSSKEFPIIELSLDTLVKHSSSVLYNAGQSDDQYIWKYEDDATIISYDSIVKFTKEGMYYVFLTNDCGSDNDSLFVKDFAIEDCDEKFKIFPNPSKNTIRIISKCGISFYEITIYNQLGQSVLHYDKIYGRIDISMLPKGLYIIEFAIKEKRIREKLIVR